MNLKPIGEPDNILIKMTDDILPDPDAILVTGITPQATLTDGITEAEFAKYFTREVCTPDTIMVGFNNIRFDDEFIRFTLWRNFYDSYEWHWKDGRSRWDMLDVVRMTRALRPEGINWPFASDGKPANRLEFLTALNKLDHESAHDALSDVDATIAVANLIKTKQPKLFDYLLSLRDKNKVAALVTKGDPIVYTSGRYSSEFEKTTIAVQAGADPNKNAALMYDLRIDPDDFTKLTPAELAKLWGSWGKDAPYFPVKTLAYNKCPAVAPLNVLDAKSKERLKIDDRAVATNLKKLKTAEDFGDKLAEAVRLMQPKSQGVLMASEQEVDGALYDGFVNDSDKTKMRVVRAADVNKLVDLELDFSDDRLKVLLPLYKARNFPKSLTPEEQEHWEQFRTHRLMDGGEKSRGARYFKRIADLSALSGEDSKNQYLLQELNLYGQSVLPAL